MRDPLNINYFSDVHRERGAFGEYTPPDDADVIVIAGDFAPSYLALRWMEDIGRHFDQPIVYVPGNHEFYGVDLYYTIKDMKQKCLDMGIYFLYNGAIEINDVMFIGTTMWTDFNLTGYQKSKLTLGKQLISDYEVINGLYGKLTPEEILDEHRYAVGFLNEKLTEYKDKPRVVITHHAPSALSLHPKDRKNMFAPYYASNLDGFVLQHQPEVWIHGHIHHTNDYMIGNTRILGNPRGYVDDVRKNHTFDTHGMVTV